NGDTVLTLSLNEKWLNAKERVFPVTVDPTVEVTGTTYVTDTMVREGAPTTAYNSMKYAVVGYSTTSSNKTNWGLYTMKSLPASIPGHTASYASLTVRQLSAANGSYSYSNPSVPSLSISARHITSSWVAGATWNTRPTYDSAILDTEYITAATEGQAFEFDITSAVNAWYAGSPNYGILFNRTVDSGSTPNCYTSFYTSEHATAANKPVFLIHFVPLSGGGGGDGFSTAPNLILNSLVSVHVALANEKRYFKFTPSTCGFYTFESSSVTSGDPYAWIYNSSQTQLHYDDDGLGYPNFRITHYLDIGHTYYFAAGCYGSGTGSYSVRLTLREIYYETFIPTKTYYLKDIGSGKFLDIHGPAAQESVHQWDFHGGEQSRWTVQKQSDGFYTIRSEYGSKYYVGISNTSLGVDNIKLYASISDSTRWIAYYNSVGEVIFEPKLAPGKILHAPSNSTGVELQLAWAGWIDNNSKWKLFEHKYEFTAKHYYDQGYDVRFANAATSMAEYQVVCSEIFLQVFGIGTKRSIQSYISCADTCTGTPVTLAKTKLPCAHSLVDHKTRSEIRSDFISQFGNGTNTLSRVAWSGHVLESRSSNSDSSSHTVVMTIGKVTDASYNNLADNVIRYESIYTLVHELSHQLGASDHYCYGNPTDPDCSNPYNDCYYHDRGLTEEPVCIMYNRWYDLEQRLNAGTISDIYCSQCKSSAHSLGIRKHLNDHH
ncbi:MAG TPA: hypothetical protein DER23_00280, partial [Clostridiales bacterium]|nr:hypothetical protein [Clostridiales bacterium]